MSDRNVVIVDPYSSGVMLAPAFRGRGYEPVMVTSSAEPPPVYAASFHPEEFAYRFTFDGDLDGLVEQLRKFQPVAVIPGAETAVELADHLVAALTPRFANAPELAAARRHKGAMERAVAARGLPTIRTISTGSASEIADWISRSGLEGHDLVVKPAKSAGTDGLAFAPSGHGWREAFDELVGSFNLFGYSNDQVVVQEYVTGTEYIVDTFSHDGVHTVSDICRYGKLRIGNHIAIYESIEFLPYDLPEHRELVEYVENVLDALGLRFGAAHSEVMLTKDGPRLIETNARLAGAGMPWTCSLATGENSIDRMVRAVDGESAIRKDFTLELPVIVAFFVSANAGVVHNVEVLQAVRDLPSFRELDVNARNGDHLSPTRDYATTMRLGFALLANTDLGQLHADHAELRRIQSTLVIEES